MTDRKPDKQDIDEAFTYYSNVWRRARQRWYEYDTFYWRTYPLWPNSQEKRPDFRPSTPASIIDHAADTYMGYTPRIKRPTYNVGDKDEERKSSTIEWFVGAVFRDAGLKEPVYPFKMMQKYLLQYGWAVLLGPVLDMSGKPKPPEKQKGESEDDFSVREENYQGQLRTWNPFRIHAPHPGIVLTEPADKEPDVALITSQRTVKQLQALSIEKKRSRQTAALYLPTPNQRPYDRETIVEYWSRDWHAVQVKGGMLLYVERNLWGFSPVAHAFSGFGQELMTSVTFDMGSDAGTASPNPFFLNDPRYLAVGLLEHTMDSLRVQAQNFAARHNLLVNASFPPLGTVLPAEEVAQRIAKGQIIEGRKDDLWVVQMPQITQSMFTAGAEVDGDIQRGTYAADIAGTRQEGVSTVGQQQLLTQQAVKKFIGPANQTEELATICGQRILRLVNVLGQLTDIKEIVVRGRGIKPSDIGTDYSLEVRFEVVDPVIDLQRRELGLREVQLGLKSEKTYRETDGHIEDEYEEHRRLIEQRLEKRPEVMAAEEAIIAREEGLKDVLDAAKAQQQQAAQAAQTGPQPPHPGSATRNLRQPLTATVAAPAPATPLQSNPTAGAD